MQNSIVWGNGTDPGDNIADTSSTVAISHTDVQGSGGSDSWNTQFGTNRGGNIDADPLFTVAPDPGDGSWETLDDNEYGDLRLASGSLARDAGDDLLIPSDVADADGDGDTAEPLPLDAAGNPRVRGGEVDMGGYESL